MDAIAHLKLLLKTGENWEETSQYPLKAAVIRIGRLSSNDIVLESKAISRRHCCLFIYPDELDYAIIDGSLSEVSLANRTPEIIPSSLGTTVNGRKLEKGEKHLLKDKDEILLPDWKLIYSNQARKPPASSGGMNCSRLRSAFSLFFAGQYTS